MMFLTESRRASHIHSKAESALSKTCPWHDTVTLENALKFQEWVSSLILNKITKLVRNKLSACAIRRTNCRLGCPSPMPLSPHSYQPTDISLPLLHQWEIFTWNKLCLLSNLLLLTAGVSCFIHVRISSVRILHRLHNSRPFHFGSSTVWWRPSLLTGFQNPRLGVTVFLWILLGSATGTSAKAAGRLALGQAGTLSPGVLGAHTPIPPAPWQGRHAACNGPLVSTGPARLLWRGLCLIVLHWWWSSYIGPGSISEVRGAAQCWKPEEKTVSTDWSHPVLNITHICQFTATWDFTILYHAERFLFRVQPVCPHWKLPQMIILQRLALPLSVSNTTVSTY